jgi:hypothetical protein
LIIDNFAAKDQPSPRAEFEHPDLAVVLTALSYYVEGLTSEELGLGSKHLQQSSQASQVYKDWVKDSVRLPQQLRHLSSVNTSDTSQWNMLLYPALCTSKSVIDYFLARLVFPQEMKETKKKLSVSSWDLIGMNHHHSAGFSGTNDSKYILPDGIQHLTLPADAHVNAEVLRKLLRDNNSMVILPHNQNSGHSDSSLLLAEALRMEPQPRVIRDAGALVTDLKNEELAAKWLSMDHDTVRTKAVIYLDSGHELKVIDRLGHTQPSELSTSQPASLIVIDSAIDRGSDHLLGRVLVHRYQCGLFVAIDNNQAGWLAC